MKNINGEELIQLLASESEIEHSNYIIDLEVPTNIDLSKITLSNKFINCEFKGARLDFLNLTISNNPELLHLFHFENCELLNDVYFKDCVIQELKFTKINKSIKNLHLAAEKIGYLTFECQRNIESEIINITIHNCEIVKYLNFLHINSSGQLLITDCNIEDTKIHNCAFKRVDIDYSKFSSDFQFTNNQITDSYIKRNVFEKSDYSLTDFGIEAKFSFNDFKGTALFEKLKNENRTKLKFVNCNFHEYTNFNNSKLYELHIDNSKFQEFTSFQELELNSIFLDRTIFEKPAFFDDIVIHRFKKCNKRTLRNIKQQLLRTDNKIDYDHFRAHELNSYKEEIKTKLKLKTNFNRSKLKRDLTILRVNSFFSNNGTDWVKAIKRTLLVAILFYSIFFGIHNFSREIALFDSNAYNEFSIGFFRYCLITDFHNPLINEKKYLSNSLEWFPFVFGKIIIGIGIFQVLISFRKFKK